MVWREAAVQGGAVNVHKDTDTPELVHWHGQMIPSAMSMAPPRKARHSCPRSRQAPGEGCDRGGPGARAAHRFSR